MERYQQSLWKYLESTNFALKQRLDMAIKLTRELKLAHDGQVVHRDLKPTNIMVDEKKKLALIDFGIGNRSDGLLGSCGTPGFNAPEQFSNEMQYEPVDIFSLGKNLILIIFEWKLGWNLLWSSEKYTNRSFPVHDNYYSALFRRHRLQSQKLEHKVAALSDLFKLIRQMTQVMLLIHSL